MPKRILIVDDDPNITDYLSGFLSETAIPNVVAKFEKPFTREAVLAQVREVLGA